MLINIKTCFLPICTFGSFTEKDSEGRLHRKYFWHFFEWRMLPLAQIEMVQLFPIQQFSFSKNRRQDVTIAHVGAYRSYFHLGLTACLEDLWSKSPLLRMALLDFTPSPWEPGKTQSILSCINKYSFFFPSEINPFSSLSLHCNTLWFIKLG